MKTLNQDQLTKYLNHVAHNRSDPWALFIELLIRSGMRSHELTMIRAEHIDLNRCMLHITAAKGSLNREVPIDKACLEALLNRLKDADSLQLSVGLGVESFKRTLRFKHAKMLIECFGPNSVRCGLHGLRAGFAMAVYSSIENDILLVKKLLGHKKLASTNHYVEAVNVEQNKTKIMKIFNKRKVA